MRRNKGLLSLLLAALLCLSLVAPASAEELASGEAGNRSIQVTVREMTPGYYLCAVWDGAELLTLFDATVGSDGVLSQTVEVGKVLERSDTLQVGISGANTGETPASYQVVLTGPETPDIGPDFPPVDPPDSGPIFGGWMPASPAPASYKITASAVTGGAVTVSPQSASKGAAVTLTVIPDEGYELASLTATDSGGGALTLTDKGGGKYTFTMPASKVTVTAVFQPIQPPQPAQPAQPVETPWSSPYTDVADGAWYYDAVKFVSENGLMNGSDNGAFLPDANLTRAQFAQILYNKAGWPAVDGGSVFTDVPEETWYADAVTWAAGARVVTGYGNGSFGPGNHITREQLAAMLWRYSGQPASAVSALEGFTDADDASAYAMDALCWAVENGVLKGKGSGVLDPKGFATRAQAAQMLMNYFQA